MAEEVQYHHHQSHSDGPRDAVTATPEAPKVEEHAAVEATDRGLFDFMGKKEKEKKCEGEVMSTEFAEKVKVSEEKKDEHKEEEEKKHEGLLQKLHRSSSSSSSSSDEEEVEGGEKKKKKKGSKEKIKDKISGEKDTSVPIEKCDDKPEEKKGFLDKIKEKLPGGKKADEVASPPPTPAPAAAAECATTPESEGKEKKGLLDKIKEKIPGYQSKSDEEKEKEKGKEGACN